MLLQPDIRPVRTGIYRLTDPYRYVWKDRDIVHRITVFKGFEHDGASVPRIVWTLSGLRPDGLIRAAALVHDWLYVFKGKLPKGSYQHKEAGTDWMNVTETWTRKQADQMFRRLMKEAGVPAYRRWLAYRAVRLFGWWYWNT